MEKRKYREKQKSQLTDDKIMGLTRGNRCKTRSNCSKQKKSMKRKIQQIFNSFDMKFQLKFERGKFAFDFHLLWFFIEELKFYIWVLPNIVHRWGHEHELVSIQDKFLFVTSRLLIRKWILPVSISTKLCHSSVNILKVWKNCSMNNGNSGYHVTWKVKHQNLK